MSNLVSINDFDIVYISYDEPNADENYSDLLDKCPWAKEVMEYGAVMPHTKQQPQ